MPSKNLRNKEKKTKTEPRGFQTPKGMHDVLPMDQVWWERVGKVARDMAEFYGFSRIETPVMENLRLYEKGTGADTDIVQKEMYVIKTKGGDVLALRPEFTPGVMRAYVQHSLSRQRQPQKLYSIGPVFRHDNPQAGRLRQFTQINLEIIGGQNDPIYDAQVIIYFHHLIEELKIKNAVLRMNSIGCKVCRPLYKRQLQNYYKNFEKKLCSDCGRRLKINPLRLLDCKREECQEFKAKAPSILDKLCVACTSHLKGVLEYLDEIGIAYQLDNLLVRGLDYYSRTVFEFFTEGAGTEAGAIAGGGRYDYLMESLGGRVTPATGGACSIERLLYVMKAQEIKPPQKIPKKVFFIHVGEMAKKKSLRIIEILRSAGISVSESLGRDSLKAQLKSADKEGIEMALILGQRELFEESIIVRDLRNSLQETVSLSKLVEEIRKRLRAQ
ncbi:MAG TPA: histidine--tRNA ligase [Candidatus Paceibacterota bacterium]